nr:caspase family protein [Azospirillum argentinense]
MVKTFAEQSASNDVSIIAFSGHGKMDKDHLSIHFKDSDGKSHGSLLIGEIALAIHKHGRGEFLLVLDCCYAGAAASATASSSVYFQSKISLLAACRSDQRALPGDRLSLFTAAIIKSIDTLVDTGQQVTIKAITEHLKADKYDNYFASIRDGIANLDLGPGINLEDSASYVSEVYTALRNSGSAERSVIWYMLADAPEVRRIRVLQDPRFSEYIEPVWLGRRAMGSCLDSVTHSKRAKIDIASRLLRSQSWIDNCVGLIGARHNLDDAGILEIFKNHLDPSFPMDSKWLSALYLSDAKLLKGQEWVDLYDTSFGKTLWGAFELLAMAADDEEAFGDLRARAINDYSAAAQIDLFSEIIASRSATLKTLDAPHLSALKKSDKDFAELLTVGVRLRTGRTGSEKWLFSKMKGNWRNQYQHSFDNMFRFRHDIYISQIAEKVVAFPDSALKLAFLDGLQKQRIKSEKIAASVSKFLKDDHPWVRREAVRYVTLIANDPSTRYLVEDAIGSAQAVDSLLYPGRLDYATVLYEMLLQVGGLEKWGEIKKTLEVSSFEEEAITCFFSRERLITST